MLFASARSVWDTVITSRNSLGLKRRAGTWDLGLQIIPLNDDLEVTHAITPFLRSDSTKLSSSDLPSLDAITVEDLETQYGGSVPPERSPFLIGLFKKAMGNMKILVAPWSNVTHQPTQPIMVQNLLIC